MAPVSAEEAAIRGALGRTHGVYKLARPLVDALVTYYIGRGESLTDIPLDIPSGGTVAHERRWRARLTAASVTDAGDAEDFLLWMEARAAPTGSGGAGSASGLAKVALVALEAAGDRPSVRGLVELEKALALGEAGDEDSQCCCAVVAFLLLWGRGPTPQEELEWDRQHSLLAGRRGGKIDILSDEKYGKLQKSSELVGRVTLKRALKSADSNMFEEWLNDMTDQLHAVNKPKAAQRLAKVVAQAKRQAHHVWEAIREYLEGYFFKEFLGLGLPAVIAESSAFICAGSPAVFAARLRLQTAKDGVGERGSIGRV